MATPACEQRDGRQRHLAMLTAATQKGPLAPKADIEVPGGVVVNLTAEPLGLNKPIKGVSDLNEESLSV